MHSDDLCTYTVALSVYFTFCCLKYHHGCKCSSICQTNQPRNVWEHSDIAAIYVHIHKRNKVCRATRQMVDTCFGLVANHMHIHLFCTVEFFDEERLLLKQELLEPEDEFSTITTTSFLKIPHTVLKAWWVGSPFLHQLCAGQLYMFCVYGCIYMYVVYWGEGGGVYVTGLGSFLPCFALSVRYLLVCYTHVFSCSVVSGEQWIPQ